MLASVAGAVRRPTTTTAMSWPDADGSSPSNGLVAEPLPASVPAPPSVLRDAMPATVDEDVDPGLTFDDDLADDIDPDAADEAAASAAPAVPAEPGADAYAASLAAVRAATAVSEPPPVAAAPAPSPAPAPMLTSSPAGIAPSFAAAAAGPTTPGAYVPPVLQPAGSAAPARAWGGQNGLDAPVAASAALAAGAPGAIDADHDDAAATSGSDVAKATEFIGWLAIAGAALALVGFLLPWSSIAVIGAGGVGYFDRWGLAGPWHILLVIGLLAMLAAALLRHRVPLWLGTGLPGMILGGLLLGLLWPYGIGPLGGALGAVAVALGALMLIGAGIGAVVVDRHVLGTRPV